MSLEVSDKEIEHINEVLNDVLDHADLQSLVDQFAKLIARNDTNKGFLHAIVGSAHNEMA